MEKNRLISLQNSGESFEKAISLYFYTMKDNYEFYKNYNVYIYYGHNLPKKNKNICAQGTIGFYEQYYSNYNIVKNLSKNYFIENSNDIIKYLIYKNMLTYRVGLKLKEDKDIYWNYIKNLPFEYLYPNHKNRILTIAMKKLNVSIVPLYFEKNLLELLLNVKDNKDKYSIYALEYNGTIGRYYLNYRDNKSFSHFYNMLKIKSVLSGNSAFLLEQILRRLNENYIVGYRNHNHEIRKNRQYVLNKILSNYNCIVEPKNYKINNLFCNQNNNLSNECKANKVYSIAYLEFLKKYVNDMELYNINEEWWNE